MPDPADRAQPPEEPDGRRRRGQVQRRRVLDGALAVIARNGIGGVSQRAVAAAAGVSAASVLYHFTSVDQLLAATLRMVNASYLDRLREACSPGADVFDVLAGLVAESTSTSREFAVAELELYLRAIRDPELRGELQSWWDAVDGAVARQVPDPQRRAALVAAVDGLFLRQLAAERPLDEAAIRALLASVGAGAPS